MHYYTVYTTKMYSHETKNAITCELIDTINTRSSVIAGIWNTVIFIQLTTRSNKACKEVAYVTDDKIKVKKSEKHCLNHIYEHF